MTRVRISPALKPARFIHSLIDGDEAVDLYPFNLKFKASPHKQGGHPSSAVAISHSSSSGQGPTLSSRVWASAQSPSFCAR